MVARLVTRRSAIGRAKATTPGRQFETVNESTRTFPVEVESLLEKRRRCAREATPEAAKTIGYRMPTFKLNDRSLVHFAAHQDHVGVYPLPPGIEAFRKELSFYV